MSKSLIAFVLAVVVIGGSLLYSGTHRTPDQPYVSAPSAQPVTQTPSVTKSAAEMPPVSSAKTFTRADVATHKNVASCWTTIGGKVYDLTAWINLHPGGSAAILSLCGVDGTAAFNAQHGGQARPAQELARFYIADLQN